MATAPAHILWITTDHMRYDGIAAHGNPGVFTPNLDRLVRGGVSFSRCYGQSPLCMPSRASFMSGCYPSQTGLQVNGQELAADFPLTVARALKPRYRTHQYGKLHFQNHHDHDLDPRARHDYGFERMALSEEPGCYDDAYTRWLAGAHPDLVDTFRVWRPFSHERLQERRTFRVLDAPWQASYSGWLGHMLSNHYSAWGGPQEATFAHAGFYAPHPPLNPTREMMAPYADLAIPDPFWREDEADDKPAMLAGMLRSGRRDLDLEVLRGYRHHFNAMITGVDLAIGQILATLEKANLLDDTLIIFGSDHGDACGDHRLVGKHPSWYESVMRLPLVFHWPKALKAQRVDGLTELVDVLPTILGLSGLPIDRRMAGRDLSADLLAGRSPAGRSECLATYGATDLMLRGERWKYGRWQRGDGVQEVLYDLDADPEEFINRANDPACASALADCRDRALGRLMEATASVLPRTARF